MVLQVGEGGKEGGGRREEGGGRREEGGGRREEGGGRREEGGGRREEGGGRREEGGRRRREGRRREKEGRREKVEGRDGRELRIEGGIGVEWGRNEGGRGASTKEEKQGARSSLQSKTTIIHTHKHMLTVVLKYTSLISKKCTRVHHAN